MNKGAAADIMLFDCQKISITFQALSDFLAVNSGRNIGWFRECHVPLLSPI